MYFSPSELLPLADAIGFNLPEALETVDGTGSTVRLSVIPARALPGLPAVMRAFLPQGPIYLELEYGGFDGERAHFHTPLIGGGLAGNLIRQVSDSLVHRTLSENNIGNDAIVLYPDGEVDVLVDAFLQTVAPGLAVTDFDMEEGRFRVEAKPRTLPTWEDDYDDDDD